MANEPLHELTAAYALDALDERERSAYEDHLEACADCRRDLASFVETAAALAYAEAGDAPPQELRSRILTAATEERKNVVPLRPRSFSRPLAAVAAVAACAAVGFGVWASTLRSSLGDERQAAAQLRAAATVLGDPSAQRLSLGARGTLVVGSRGDAVLVASRLPAAESGKTYEAWVIMSGRPVAAGLFRGGHDVDVLRLTREVRPGDVVAVTVERAGGVTRPTTAPFMHAQV
jgi:anti-sigma-K factor RskA